MKTFAALSALLIAAPALSSELSPLQIFVAHRASTVCIVSMGLETVDKALKEEMQKTQRMGLTPSQYANFNEASGDGEWVGDEIDEVIERMGGCEKVYRDAMQELRHERPAYQL